MMAPCSCPEAEAELVEAEEEQEHEATDEDDEEREDKEERGGTKKKVGQEEAERPRLTSRLVFARALG